VGTSFTGYRDRAFWTRDAALETVLVLLALELEPLAVRRLLDGHRGRGSGYLSATSDRWRLDRRLPETVDQIACYDVSHQLWQLTEPTGR
jgi:hypothetical protein